MYKFGGEVYYDEVKNSTQPILLLAGGIGINPLLSIMQTAAVMSKQPISLMYSSKTAEELIFKVC